MTTSNVDGWDEVDHVLTAGFEFFKANPTSSVSCDGRHSPSTAPATSSSGSLSSHSSLAAAEYFERNGCGRFRRHDPEQLLPTGYGALLSYFSDAPLIAGLLDRDPHAEEAMDQRLEHVRALFNVPCDRPPGTTERRRHRRPPPPPRPLTIRCAGSLLPILLLAVSIGATVQMNRANEEADPGRAVGDLDRVDLATPIFSARRHPSGCATRSPTPCWSTQSTRCCEPMPRHLSCVLVERDGERMASSNTAPRSEPTNSTASLRPW